MPFRLRTEQQFSEINGSSSIRSGDAPGANLRRDDGRRFAVRRADPQHSRHRHFRWLWHPMFRPSHESLLLQNAEVDRLDLPRIQDDTELEALKADGSWYRSSLASRLKIEPSLDPSRRFCRPWTLNFVKT